MTFVREHKKSEYFTSFIEILKIGKYHLVFSSVNQKEYPALPDLQSGNNCLTIVMKYKALPFQVRSGFQIPTSS